MPKYVSLYSAGAVFPRLDRRVMIDIVLFPRPQIQGKVWLEASEAYTTKGCAACGHINDMSLMDRIFRCQQCSLEMPRDEHSALSISLRVCS